jgi:hypothetical protein
MDDAAKVFTLGLAIMNVMGEDVLRSAIASLGPQAK